MARRPAAGRRDRPQAGGTSGAVDVGVRPRRDVVGAPATLAAAATVAVAVAVAVVTVVVLTVTGQLRSPPDGLLDPGPLTRRAVPALIALRDVAAALTVGPLALAVLTMQTRETLDTDDLGPRRTGVVRFASTAAAAWAAVTAALVVLTFSEVTGRPVGTAGFWTGFGGFLVDVQLGRLLAGGAVLAAVVAIGARVVRSFSTTAVLALLAAGAVLPVALTGHAAAEADHAAAVNTMVVHLLGATTWAGGLAGLVLLRAIPGRDVVTMAHRFSAVAGVCFVAVGVSGVWRLLLRVEGPQDLLSTYGALAAAKVVLLLALGVAGAVHRRRTLRALDADPRRLRPFLRLVGAELALMGAAFALGAALSRTT